MKLQTARSATMSHEQVPGKNGKKKSTEVERKFGGSYCKHRIHGFPLAESPQALLGSSCQEGRGSSFLSLWALPIITEHESSLFWSPNSIWLNFLFIHFWPPIYDYLWHVKVWYYALNFHWQLLWKITPQTHCWSYDDIRKFLERLALEELNFS